MDLVVIITTTIIIKECTIWTTAIINDQIPAIFDLLRLREVLGMYPTSSCLISQLDEKKYENNDMMARYGIMFIST